MTSTTTFRLMVKLILAPLLFLPCTVARPSEYRLVAASGHAGSPLDTGSPGFGADGTTYLRDEKQLIVLRNGTQVAAMDFEKLAEVAINRDIPDVAGQWDRRWDRGFMNDKSVVSDASGRLYTLLIPRYSNLRNAALLWSDNGGRDWHALKLPGRNAAIERPDAFNDHAGPPTVLSFENYGGVVGKRLWLNLFKDVGGAILPDGPSILISSNSILAGNHSGAANSTFTTKGQVFVAFNADDCSTTGTKIVVRQVDRARHALVGDEVVLGRSLTQACADGHDIPAITMGPDRRLIVIIGAHHALLQWVRADAQDSAVGGWSSASPIGTSGLAKGDVFTYVSLAMSSDGTLNLISRLTDASARYPLVQLRKPWNKPWQRWPDGSIVRPIAEPDRSHYSAWRQRLTVDSLGQLYLNFRYYPNMLTRAEAAQEGLVGTETKDCGHGLCWYVTMRERGAVTLVSTDDGLTWH
ncbi:hypothetical protein [Novosphingobium sp.]|uniref:hypothetical protein n=1 Tax=Novosphingobium sp. TaxID=1874826 RepID=UPI002601FDF3|nr:hypothetical protein [Novosphingobium sp.]